MSYYNHINDSKGNRKTCGKCNKEFKWSQHGPYYPGGIDTEFIECPYCGEKNGSVRTSGFVSSSKLD